MVVRYIEQLGIEKASNTRSLRKECYKHNYKMHLERYSEISLSTK